MVGDPVEGGAGDGGVDGLVDGQLEEVLLDEPRTLAAELALRLGDHRG